MAITNVACPDCGKQTNGTIPRNATLQKVKRKSRNVKSSRSTTNTCVNCGYRFYVQYTS